MILPKISRGKSDNLEIFMFMILYSHNITEVNNFDTKENMYEIFIDIFSRNLLKLINQTGLYKEYITVQDDVNFLKGKLILKEFILRNNFNSKFTCEYDEFSTNHKLNQSLIYTIKEMKRFSKNKTNLVKLEKIFNEVTPIYHKHIEFNHLNVRFKESYNLANFLLKNVQQKKVHSFQNFSFMFDMDRLFEDFIGKIFQDIFQDTKLQTIQYFANLRLEPDIILHNLVIDLKYKIFKNDFPKKEDKYQMYLYGNNFEKKQTMLLYPKHKSDISQRFLLGNNDSQHQVILTAKTIDLDSDLDYDGYIQEIRNRTIKLMEDFR